MKKCAHPEDQVKADILEGDFKSHQVQWCQQCGSYRIRHYDEEYYHRHIENPSRRNFYTDWVAAGLLAGCIVVGFIVLHFSKRQ